MSTRFAFRSVTRRFSSSGKVLGEEEKAAENVYIKKIEKEKLEKLAHKGPKPDEKSGAATSGGGPKAVPAAKPNATSSSTEGVSTDKHRNYAVVVGVITALGATGWYYKSKDKKIEETQD